MFKYFKKAFVRRVDHPILGLMYVIAGLFLAGGLLIAGLAQYGIAEWEIGAAFFGVFAVFFASIGTVGYVLLVVGKGLSVARDRVAPTS